MFSQQNSQEENDNYFFSLEHQIWSKMTDIQYIHDINDKVKIKENNDKDNKD